MQVAIFVDSGFVYAQGSALLAGQKQPRTSIRLDVETVLRHLRVMAHEVAPEARLLRTYWYDGLIRGGRPTADQSEVAQSADTKLRLGMVNSKGEQKGVDALIVTDLIDLARNRAITDALIVSGDEDIRVGVQVAQTFGVRVHLLGIQPARGCQSPDLIQEADTHHEWRTDVIASFLYIQSASEPATLPDRSPEISASGQTEPMETVRGIVAAVVQDMEAKTLAVVLEQLDMNRDRIPPDVDRPVLSRVGYALGRDLTDEERKAYRRLFVATLRAARGRDA